jgi:hypothetical protein
MVKEVTIDLELIPNTMKGKELLKKIFYGNWYPLKEEIEEGTCEYMPPERISSEIYNFEYKVIYVVGRIGWIKGLVHRRGRWERFYLSNPAVCGIG